MCRISYIEKARYVTNSAALIGISRVFGTEPKLREIYADATDISKAALEDVIRAVQSGEPGTESVPMESAGRIGAGREMFRN
jgi:hypothetical protein